MVQDVFLTLPNGAVVRDRYVIEDLLGKGGFASVYLVKDKRVKGNLFALKEVIDPSKQERDRFTFECEILRRLDHPALPRVYHAFSDDEMLRAYMLMDYIEGPNLEILRQKQSQRRLPLMQVMGIMAPIIDAIAYLHSQQPPIIHRDIKPSNIIVPAVGDQAVLVDFGIAKEYEPDSTTTTVRRCSPGYGAPEQYGGGTDTHTDIYGLAATLYALLTGKIPADAFQRMMQLGSKGVDPLVPVIQLMPDIPLSVSEAIQRAMRISSNDRFATVKEFWQELQAGLPAIDRTDVDVQTVILSTSYSSSSLAKDDLIVLTPLEEGEDARGDEQVRSTDALQDNHAYAETEDATIVARHDLPPATPALVSLEQPTFRLVKVPIFSARRRSMNIVLLCLVLLIGAGIAASLWSYTALQAHNIANQRRAIDTKLTQVILPTAKVPAFIPTITMIPSPATYPNLAYLSGTYQGSLTDTITSHTSHMTIIIRQIRGHANFDGRLILNLLQGGNSSFSGVIDVNNNFSFTSHASAGHIPFYFYGVVQPGGYLRGNFCSSRVNHCKQDTGYFTVGPRY
jgi:eukaryotic-like serine/threonine-protein kinase